MAPLKDRVPALYHGVLPSLFDREAPDETVATCHTCPYQMDPHGVRVNTKCCAYHPRLPNYLAGAILEDHQPASATGRRRLLRRILTRQGVTPLGMLRPPAYVALNARVRSADGRLHGKDELEALLCPYYDGGQCSIWRHRESTCSTSFCFSTGGEHGKDFWEALRVYLKRVEARLSRHIAVALGVDEGELNRRVDSRGLRETRTALSDAEYAALWHGWVGREPEFFEACHQMAARLNRDTFNLIMGADHDGWVSGLAAGLDRFRRGVFPEFLRFDAGAVVTQEAAVVTVTTPRGRHRLPPWAYLIVRQCDGSRTTTEVAHLGYRGGLNIQAHLSGLIGIGALVATRPPTGDSGVGSWAWSPNAD